LGKILSQEKKENALKRAHSSIAELFHFRSIPSIDANNTLCIIVIISARLEFQQRKKNDHRKKCRPFHPTERRTRLHVGVYKKDVNYRHVGSDQKCFFVCVEQSISRTATFRLSKSYRLYFKTFSVSWQ